MTSSWKFSIPPKVLTLLVECAFWYSICSKYQKRHVIMHLPDVTYDCLVSQDDNTQKKMTVSCVQPTWPTNHICFMLWEKKVVMVVFLNTVSKLKRCICGIILKSRSYFQIICHTDRNAISILLFKISHAWSSPKTGLMIISRLAREWRLQA